MSSQTDRPRVLSIHRAFVVHFDIDTQVNTGRVGGQVEHVVSGRVTRFESVASLLAFVDHVLSERGHDTPESP